LIDVFEHFPSDNISADQVECSKEEVPNENTDTIISDPQVNRSGHNDQKKKVVQIYSSPKIALFNTTHIYMYQLCIHLSQTILLFSTAH